MTTRPGMSMVAAALGFAALGLAMPSVAHADAAGPSQFRSHVVAVSPADAPIEVSIEGGDSFVRINVSGDHEVIVLGYDDEPYLRLADGEIVQNRLSPSTYQNEERFGIEIVDEPDFVDPDAPPDWERVGTGRAWSWHDHRAHWMGDTPPLGLEPGQSLPAQEIPLEIDGRPATITVQTTLVANPSWIPAAAGLLSGLALALVALVAGPAATIGAGLVLSALALVVGAGQYWSLPAETGPLPTWWLLPALALAAVMTAIGLWGRSMLTQRALAALAGLQLASWAFQRRDGLTAPVLPTDLPFWFDRSVTAAALVGGTLITIGAVRSLVAAAPPS